MMNDRAEFRRKEQPNHRSEQQKRGGNYGRGAATFEGEEQQRLLSLALAPSLVSSQAPVKEEEATAATPASAAVVGAMKDVCSRTKVVVRRLPPSLPKASFLEQIESRFAGLYNWICFYPGKSSHKGHVYSRAYIDFKRPEDVLEFYDTFEGHIFLNEKGTQYKALVEYAPYQRVPKTWSKKDIREGMISKDPEYLEFLEMLARPVEYLPSAEVQLERKEAERAANLASSGVKETVIVTPLMEFVRHKRASKAAPQRPLSASGKMSARGGGSAATSSSSIIPKRGVERSRATIMYLPSQASGKQKEKSTYVPRREDNQRRERELITEKKRREALELKETKNVREVGSLKLATGNHQAETCEDIIDTNLSLKDSHKAIAGEGLDQVPLPVAVSTDVEQYGTSGHSLEKLSANIEANNDAGKDGRDLTKKKQLLLKEKDLVNGAPAGNLVLTGCMSTGPPTSRHRSTAFAKSPSRSQSVTATVQQCATSPGRGVPVASGFKQSQRRETGIRPGRGYSSLTHAVSPQQSQCASQSDNYNQQVEKDKRPPRSQTSKISAKELSSGTVSPGSSSEVEAGLQHINAPVDEKGSQMTTNEGHSYGVGAEKQDGRRLRNKDRPDRPVWTVRRRGDTTAGSGTGEKGVESRHDLGQQGDANAPGYESGLSFTGLPVQMKIRNHEIVSRVYKYSRSQEQSSNQGDVKNELVLLSRSSDVKISGVGRNLISGSDNGDNSVQTGIFVSDKEKHKQEASAYWNDTGGNHNQVRRERNSRQGAKDVESSSSLPEGTKPAKRGGGASAHGSHEKQVWVAKSGSGS